MEALTKQQIETVYNWLKEWEILDETVIPLRFKEQFSKQFNTPRVSECVKPVREGTVCPVCGIEYWYNYRYGEYEQQCDCIKGQTGR